MKLTPKRVIVVVLCLAALIVITVCVFEVIRQPHARTETANRFVKLWNAGRMEEALDMFHPKAIQDRSSLGRVLEAIQDNFGSISLREATPPAVYWPYAVGDIGSLSFVYSRQARRRSR